MSYATLNEYHAKEINTLEKLTDDLNKIAGTEHEPLATVVDWMLKNKPSTGGQDNYTTATLPPEVRSTTRLITEDTFDFSSLYSNATDNNTCSILLEPTKNTNPAFLGTFFKTIYTGFYFVYSPMTEDDAQSNGWLIISEVVGTNAGDVKTFKYDMWVGGEVRPIDEHVDRLLMGEVPWNTSGVPIGEIRATCINIGAFASTFDNK